MSSVRLIVSTPDTSTTMGTCSQAVKLGQIVWRSGWIPLDPTPSRLLGGQTGLFQGMQHEGPGRRELLPLNKSNVVKH